MELFRFCGNLIPCLPCDNSKRFLFRCEFEWLNDAKCIEESYLKTRAGSVLTETEKPAVFDDFFGTETEMEPMFANFQNRERIGTEISVLGVPKV